MLNSPISRAVVHAAALLAVVSTAASAQIRRPPIARIANLAGPRFGVTVLGGNITTRLRDEYQIDVAPMITQFGWQSEKQFGGGEDTPFVGVTELVFLAGGLEQNQFLPSISWLVGFRTESGYELGVGPNVTPISSALALAAGMTHSYGALNVPINLAVVPSRDGVRVSILAGFNMRR